MQIFAQKSPVSSVAKIIFWAQMQISLKFGVYPKRFRAIKYPQGRLKQDQFCLRHLKLKQKSYGQNIENRMDWADFLHVLQSGCLSQAQPFNFWNAGN